MSNRVSIVMAVHNGARFLGESVKSILTQTYDDFEFVVVNDGSTDQTAQILKEFQKEDSRLKIINQERMGFTASINRAINETDSEYIARHDADDIALEGRLERQLAFLDMNTNVGVVGCAAETIDASGNRLGPITTYQGCRRVREGLFNLRATLFHPSVMMKRSVFRSVGGYRDAFPIAQDLDLWLRMVSECEIDNIPDVLCKWRLNPNGVYLNKRELQLKYSGIAISFAHERKRFGSDSYALMRDSNGDLEKFASRYQLKGMLYSLWGELLFRGLHDAKIARENFRQALKFGYVHPKTVAFFGWTACGLPWPGRASLGHDKRKNAYSD